MIIGVGIFSRASDASNLSDPFVHIRAHSCPHPLTPFINKQIISYVVSLSDVSIQTLDAPHRSNYGSIQSTICASPTIGLSIIDTSITVTGSPDLRTITASTIVDRLPFCFPFRRLTL